MSDVRSTASSYAETLGARRWMPGLPSWIFRCARKWHTNIWSKNRRSV